MIPGTILFDRNFQFKDGNVGEKYFIVLNDGSCSIYVGIKITSQGRRYGILHGCQVLERYPCFLLTKGCCCLPKNSWAQLDTFFEFRSAKLMEKVMTGQINRQGILPEAIIRELLVCTTHAEDLTLSQELIIQESLRHINQQATPQAT